MALSLNQTTVIDLGPMVAGAYPISMVGWFRVPSTSNALTLLRVDDTTTTSYHTLAYEGNSTGRLRAVTKATAVVAALSTAPLVPGQWHHAAGVFEANNARRVYLDGGNMDFSGHTQVIGEANLFRAGNINSSTAIDAAEIAIFAGVLSEDEIIMLSRGCPVLSLPSANVLLTYHDCLRRINRPGTEPLGSTAIAPPVVEHPRVLMSHRGRTLTQPWRVHGPLQVEQSELAIAGVADDAGQSSIAGIAGNSSLLFGEVHC